MVPPRLRCRRGHPLCLGASLDHIALVAISLKPDEGTDQKSEEEGEGTTEKERHRTTGTEVEMEDTGPGMSTGGKQVEGTMETAGNSMVQQHKRARPETPAGARGEIFSYNPALKCMTVTRVNVKDELVQILDGIKEVQLEKEREKARDEARWENWTTG